jgi:hypothetical protein
LELVISFADYFVQAATRGPVGFKKQKDIYPRPSKYSAWLWCPIEKLKGGNKAEGRH